MFASEMSCVGNGPLLAVSDDLVGHRVYGPKLPLRQTVSVWCCLVVSIDVFRFSCACR